MSRLWTIVIGAGPNWLEDAVLLIWRCAVGSFLIWGVSDNIVDAANMAEFAAFLAAHGFVYPDLLAPVSVGAQSVIGVCFILGLGTRLAGLACAFNFAIAIAMVDARLGIRAAFPASMLVLFGLYLAARGPGAFGVDAWLAHSRLPEQS